MHIQPLDCCGAFELVGINDINWSAKNYLLKYCDASDLMLNRGKSFVVFSYAWDVINKNGTVKTNRSYAQGRSRIAAFKKLIEDNKLGTIQVGKTAQYNPNYGKLVRLRACLFIPNNDAIRQYLVSKKQRSIGTQTNNGIQWEILTGLIT